MARENPSGTHDPSGSFRRSSPGRSGPGSVSGGARVVVRAARYGMPMMLAIIGGPPERFLPYIELYHRTLERLGTWSCRLAYTHLDTSRTRMRVQRTSYGRHSRSCATGSGRSAAGVRSAAPSSIARPIRAPCTVAPLKLSHARSPRLHRLSDRPFDMKYSAGTLSHESSCEAFELYGTRVIPRVRDILGSGH